MTRSWSAPDTEAACGWPTSCCAWLLSGSSSRTLWKQRLAAMALPRHRWHFPSLRWPCGQVTHSEFTCWGKNTGWGNTRWENKWLHYFHKLDLIVYTKWLNLLEGQTSSIFTSPLVKMVLYLIEHTVPSWKCRQAALPAGSPPAPPWTDTASSVWLPGFHNNWHSWGTCLSEYTNDNRS